MLGVGVRDGTWAETLASIEPMIASHKPHLIVTPNVDYITQAQHSPALFTMLKAAERAVPDGLEILAVAMGTPRQEFFMARHQHRMGIPVMIGVGSTFDRMSGDVPVPPGWMTKVGLEWLFRIPQDPKRLGRRSLLEDPIFFWWVVQQRFGWRQFPLFAERYRQ
ncbi:MAG: WecB/TagA/CpsF family glycosyltransferase [Chloroflexota bacterium]|nr:WecB/TagA/CpsF family glycosyltransferase [Dehalococcoidia bacterium]MDW8252643.1 WecB/TagA/CpsF family glycosyltransferase [Chloroflexota bacterium]